MTTQRDPETTLASWLDEGPTELPPATRRAILTALPTTSQAGRGPFGAWRRRPFAVAGRLAAAAVAVVVVIVGTALVLTPRQGIGGPGASPSPTPTPTPSPGASAVVVDRQAEGGYRLTLPSAWNAIAGPESPMGPTSVIVSPPSPVWAAYLFEGGLAMGPNPEYVIDQVPTLGGGAHGFRGHDLAELIASVDAWRLREAGAGSTAQHPVAVDGEPGLASEHVSATPPQLIIDAVVIHGDRALAIEVGGPVASAADVRAALDQLLAAIAWSP